MPRWPVADAAPTTSSTCMPRPGDRCAVRVRTGRVADWDRDLAAAAGRGPRLRTGSTREVPLPASLSASAVVRLAARPGRPGPRPGPADAAPARAGRHPRHPVPRLGRGAVRRRQPLLDRIDLEGAADDDLAPPTTTSRRCRRRSSRVRTRPAAPPGRGAVPARARWTGWSAVASTRSTARGRRYDVVDWKTGRSRAQTRCSSRSTAPPGRGSPASPRSPSARRSTTSRPGGSCAPRTCRRRRAGGAAHRT